MRVYHSGSDADMPLGRLLQVHANSYQECPAVFTGDIMALVGNPGLRTGDTLCAAEHPVLLEALRFPEPVMTMAVEPKRSEERERMMFVLREMTHQDPTFRIRTDSATGQTVLEGMGELHLEIILERMRRESGVDVTVGRPQVARRATVKQAAAGEARLDRTLGVIRQVGSLKVSLEPRKRGEGISLEITVPETHVPRVFHTAIRDGIHSAAEDGVGTGHPLTDLHVSVTEGTSVPDESSEPIFRLLAINAFEQAAKTAEICLLEPLMTVVVSCPPEFTGDVIGEMGMRHGRVIEVEALPRTTRITCLVPLVAMFGYATALRSLSSGRAVFSSEFACFAEASDHEKNRK
jgi:elongation factor G